MKIDISRFRTRTDSGEFRVPLHELGEFRLGEIPPHSTVWLTDLPPSPAGYDLGIHSTNCEDAGDSHSLGITITVGVVGTANIDKRLSRIRRAFEPEVESGAIQNASEMRMDFRGQPVSFIGYTQDFSNQPQTIFADAISPVLRAFNRLIRPDVRLFVCHASEDKPTARACSAL